MAALLPGRKLSVNDGMDVLVDEMPTRSTDERGKVLRAANMNSVAVQYTDVLNMKRAERRELVSGKEVVYIYHNTIDAIGDKAPTEKRCLRLAKMLCRSFPIFFVLSSTICRVQTFSSPQITVSSTHTVL